TTDQHSVVKVSDFYSARQWHSTGMYTDHDRPLGQEHFLMLTLPGSLAAPGRYVRLTLARGSGPDFSERDRALLTLLRPHLDQAARARHAPERTSAGGPSRSSPDRRPIGRESRRSARTGWPTPHRLPTLILQAGEIPCAVPLEAPPAGEVALGQVVRYRGMCG